MTQETLLGHITPHGYLPAGWRRCQWCRRPVHPNRLLSHTAAHKRARTVWETSMDMNRRGVNFQPGQDWVAPGNGAPRRTRRPRGGTR